MLVDGGENPYQNAALANPSKKRFTSYDRRNAKGQDYAVNRFYSPQQGRFTQVDPIGMNAVSLGNPQTLNMYAYCGNDPINCVDPDGLFFGFIIGAIAAIASAVVAAVQAVIAVVVKVLVIAAKALSFVVGKLGFIIRSNASQLMVSLEDDIPSGGIDWGRVAIVAGILVGIGAVAIQAQDKTPEKSNKKRPRLKRKGEANEGPPDGQTSTGVTPKIVIAAGGATITIYEGAFAPKDPDDPMTFKDCVEKELVSTFGSFLGKKVIPFFSIMPLFDGLKSALTWVRGAIISVSTKGSLSYGPWGYGKLLTMIGKRLAAYPGQATASANALESGLFWANTGKTLGKGLGVVGTTMMVLATGADVWARIKCSK